MNRANKYTNSIIMAAGISKRMQTLKAFLSYDEKYCFFERIISVYSDWGCNEIVVVVNQLFLDQMPKHVNSPAQITLVLNEKLEFERFYSIKIGLQKMKNADYCFIQNIDNPFITPCILDKIFDNKSLDAFVIPTFENKGGHPILINRSNIEYLKSYPEDNSNLRQVIGKMPSIKVEMEDESVLININNTVDYNKYFNIIQN